jgi:hypothetical protein
MAAPNRKANLVIRVEDVIRFQPPSFGIVLFVNHWLALDEIAGGRTQRQVSTAVQNGSGETL